ncbi:hypothetical protein ACFWUZ_12475 [Streptomyces sp. NPDC058646]|uniref:hypothetical protein n=1 Tax=Streptomyces sp. NPDC058646 TaxID=3346574 RepID=UPI00365EDD09
MAPVFTQSWLGTATVGTAAEGVGCADTGAALGEGVAEAGAAEPGAEAEPDADAAGDPPEQPAQASSVAASAATAGPRNRWRMRAPLLSWGK